MMQNLLQEELQTYERERSRLLGEAEGKFVLIHGSEILGPYESEMDAVSEGYRRFGNVPFLVKRVVQVEEVEHLISGLLGI